MAHGVSAEFWLQGCLQEHLRLPPPVGHGMHGPVSRGAVDCDIADVEAVPLVDGSAVRPLPGTAPRLLFVLFLGFAVGLLLCSWRGSPTMAIIYNPQSSTSDPGRGGPIRQFGNNGPIHRATQQHSPAQRTAATGSTHNASAAAALANTPAAGSTHDASAAAALISTPSAGITTTPALRTNEASTLRQLDDSSLLDSKTVTILANTQYGLPGFDEGVVPDCPVKCVIRRDAEALKTANVVVWNPRWMTPIKDISESQVASKPRSQKWVFNFDFEAPVYMGSKVGLDMTRRLAPGIDWTMTYRTSSNFFKPNFQLVPPKDKHVTVPRNNTDSKSMLLLWLVSNCVEPRMSIFRRLSSYLPKDRVKIIGACGEQSGCGAFKQEDKACFAEMIGKFKFYASFENSRCEGYITEKLSRAYESGMVPVVWGGLKRADYEAVVPKDSFIHVDDFGSIELLAKHLMRLDDDDVAYNRYFEWKARLHLASGKDWALSRYCLLCQEVRKPPDTQQPTKTFGNLVDWWYSSSCLSDPQAITP